MENGPKTPPEAIEVLNKAYDTHAGAKEIRLTTDETGTTVLVGNEIIFSSPPRQQENTDP